MPKATLDHRRRSARHSRLRQRHGGTRPDWRCRRDRRDGRTWHDDDGRAEAAGRPRARFRAPARSFFRSARRGKPEGSDSTTGLNKPASVAVDAAASELYVADGFGNRRLVVFDAETGAYKRHWGGTGEAR
jgi:hypothetical protein